MADIAVLGLRVDANGAIVATRQLGTALNTLGDRADASSSSLARMGSRFLQFVSATLVIRKFLEETKTAQAAQAQLDAVLRSTGSTAGQTKEQLNQMASELQNLSIYGDDAVTAVQALLLTFRGIKGKEFDAATMAVLNLATALKKDLQGASILVGKALNDPARGVMILQKAGVNFTASQKDLVKQLVDTGKTAEAQRIILRELESEFGGSALAARNTLGGALAYLANSFGDLFEVSERGTSSLVAFINRVAAALRALNSNREVLYDIAKALGVIALAYIGLATYARAAALATIALASAQTIVAFFSLAKAVRSASDAMALFSLVGKGAAGAVAAIAAVAVGYLAYKKLVAEVAKEQEKFNAALDAAANAPPPSTAPSGGLSDESIKARAAAQELVTVSQQNLALVNLTGTALFNQQKAYDALNAKAKAKLELSGQDLKITTAAIDKSTALDVEANRLKTLKEIVTAGKDRVALAKQVYDQVGLEDVQLGLVRLEQEKINDLTAARRIMTEEELSVYTSWLNVAYMWNKAALEGNAILSRRKEKQEELNEKARKYLEDQKDTVDNFRRQLQQTLSDGFESVIKGGLKSFAEFASSIRDLLIKAFSDVLASQVIKQLSGVIAGIALTSSKAFAQISDASVKQAGGLGPTGAGIGGAVVGFGVGYGVGSATPNRAIGALGGAAAGAGAGALAGTAILPGFGTVIGAIVGGIAGMIGGLIGSSKKATEVANQMRAAQKQIRESMEAIRASFANDALGVAVAQARTQFEELRKGIESAFSGKKNEAERNRLLQESYELEAKRIRQLQEEYDEKQRVIQQDAEVRRLLATGHDEEAAALAEASAQERELANLRKEGASAAAIAAVAAAHAAETEQRLAEARKKAAREAEEERRNIADLKTATQAFTDPRGAADATFAEEQARRVFDAIERGASEAELAALALYNAAEKARRTADLLEQDFRATEALVARGLQASGKTRQAEDVAVVVSQRQEMFDAIRAGMSETNLALLKFVQFAERSQLQMQRAIEDGTKAIREQTEKEIDSLNLLIEAVQNEAAAQIKKLDEQIAAIREQADVRVAALDAQIASIELLSKTVSEGFDKQIDAARNALDVARQQASALEQQVQVSQKIASSLGDFLKTLRLGDLSPLSPEKKLAEARAQFDALAAAAKSGDTKAAEGLPGAAQALLQASRAYNASGAGYTKDFNLVESVLSEVQAMYASPLELQQQAVKAAQQQVAYAEANLASLEKQKRDAEDAARKQIEALQKVRQQVEDSAKRQIDALEKEKTKISEDARVTIEKLEATKKAIETAAQRQIDQLVKVETEAHLARIQQNEYWEKFLSTIPDVESGTGPVAPLLPVGSSTSELQQQEIAEVRNNTKVLAERLSDVASAITTLINVTAVGDNANAEGLASVRNAMVVLANETRAVGNAALARSASGLVTR